MHFLRNLFANLVSLIVFSVITVLVVLISLLSVGDDFEVTDNSILHIKVNGDLKDQSKGWSKPRALPAASRDTETPVTSAPFGQHSSGSP